jgi:thiamine biosynthesis lipoprotein
MVLTDSTAKLNSGCAVKQGGADGWYQLAFEAMGTDCVMDYEAVSYARADEFGKCIYAWIGEFEDKYSRFRPGSIISRINAAAGREWTPIDAELESIFLLCDNFHWQTSGVFDPTALPLFLLWDYHDGNERLPSEDEVRHALSLKGWNEVRREDGAVLLPREDMAVGIGGIGKEYAVDRVFEMAREQGICNAMVNFGFDLRVMGSPPEGGPWRIGLENPLDPGTCWGGVGVHDRAVATSGNYQRAMVINGKRYGHIIDPRTGYPVENGCQSVSVVAPTCTEAGVLATSAFVLGPEEGMDLLERVYQPEGCIVMKSRRIESRRFHRYVIAD